MFGADVPKSLIRQLSTYFVRIGQVPEPTVETFTYRTTSNATAERAYQSGQHAATFAAASSGTFTVTFPTAFAVSGADCVATPANTNIVIIGIQSETSTGFTVTWRTYDGSSITALTVKWHAVGAPA